MVFDGEWVPSRQLAANSLPRIRVSVFKGPIQIISTTNNNLTDLEEQKQPGSPTYIMKAAHVCKKLSSSDGSRVEGLGCSSTFNFKVYSKMITDYQTNMKLSSENYSH